MALSAQIGYIMPQKQEMCHIGLGRTQISCNKITKEYNEKKCSERCKHCTLVLVRRSQKISPRCRPLPRGAGWPKFNQLEMVTTFTYKPSLVRIDACNFKLLW